MNDSTPTWLSQIQDSLPAGQYLLVKEELRNRASIIAEQAAKIERLEQQLADLL